MYHTRISRAAHVLTEEELFSRAPSIFATQAHESRSQRFKPIPTIDVVRGLSKEGFHPVGVKQCRTRDESKREFTKHLIRFRKDGDIQPTISRDSVLEIVLRNANDGTSAYDLMAGMWREVCMNGLVVKTDHIDAIKVRHSGDVVSKVIEGTYSVLSQSEAVLAAPEDWGRLRLTRDHAMAYATSAHMLRFDDTPTPIKPEQLLIPRRREDNAPDLWSVFNVVQENAIKGGLSGTRASLDNNGRMRIRNVTTREVKGIDQDVKLNQALWKLTETMARLAA